MPSTMGPDEAAIDPDRGLIIDRPKSQQQSLPLALLV